MQEVRNLLVCQVAEGASAFGELLLHENTGVPKRDSERTVQIVCKVIETLRCRHETSLTQPDAQGESDRTNPEGMDRSWSFQTRQEAVLARPDAHFDARIAPLNHASAGRARLCPAVRAQGSPALGVTGERLGALRIQGAICLVLGRKSDLSVGGTAPPLRGIAPRLFVDRPKTGCATLFTAKPGRRKVCPQGRSWDRGGLRSSGGVGDTGPRS